MEGPEQVRGGGSEAFEAAFGRERILGVHSNATAARELLEPLRREGYRVTGVVGVAAARERLQSAGCDLLLCELRLPDGSGAELARELDRVRPQTPVLLVADVPDVAQAAGLVGAGARGYMVKPVHEQDVIVAVHGSLHDGTLDAAIIGRMAVASEPWDPHAAAHIAAVGGLASRLAGYLGLSAARRLGVAALLHDVGNFAVPAGVLDRPGVLSERERAEAQTHCEHGYRTLAGTGHELLELAAAIAWCHHERFDGSGYPRGLEGHATPVEARIVAVADVFDALTRDRPHRAGFAPTAAAEIVTAGRGTHFDPDVVEALVVLLRDGHVYAPPPTSRAPGAVSLSPRERQVLRLAADGNSSAGIAAALVLSVGTVKTHFRNIYSKLGAQDRASAVARAMRDGIIT